MIDFLILLLTFVAIYSILGISLNLVVGYTGLLSIAQAAFYGIGAYTSSLLMINFGLNFFVALLLSMTLTGVIAFLIGLVLSRFDGDYYALVSLGFVIIVFSLFLNLDSITRGPKGIPGIPKPEFFGFSFSDSMSLFLLAIVLTTIIYEFAKYLTQSSFGRVLKAIREDETALQVFGYKTTSFKLVIFVIGASLAAVAGSLYATFITFINPSTFSVMESVFILAIIILGGLASLRGSVIGALVWVALPEFLRLLGLPQEIAAQLRQALLGLVLILLMMYRPQGFVGEYKL